MWDRSADVAPRGQMIQETTDEALAEMTSHSMAVPLVAYSIRKRVVLAAGRARGLATRACSQPQALEALGLAVAVKGSLRRASPALDSNGKATEMSARGALICCLGSGVPPRAVVQGSGIARC